MPYVLVYCVWHELFIFKKTVVSTCHTKSYGVQACLYLYAIRPSIALTLFFCKSNFVWWSIKSHLSIYLHCRELEPITVWLWCCTLIALQEPRHQDDVTSGMSTPYRIMVFIRGLTSFFTQKTKQKTKNHPESLFAYFIFSSVKWRVQ